MNRLLSGVNKNDSWNNVVSLLLGESFHVPVLLFTVIGLKCLLGVSILVVGCIGILRQYSPENCNAA